MEKLKKIKESNRFRIIYAVLVNAVFMSVFLMFTNLHYEMPDDYYFVQHITDGFPQFYYMSFIFGDFISLVQNIIYPVNAYVVIMLAFSFIGMISLTKVFLDKFSLSVATAIMLFINGFFAVNHYATIAYTREAGFLSIVGALCVIHYIGREKWILGTIVGGLLLLVGSMYRFQIFETCVALTVAYVIGASIAKYFSIEKNKRKFKNLFLMVFNLKRLIACGIILLICFSVFFAESAVYKNDEKLSYFVNYSIARSNVYDFRMPEYEECKEEYDKLNVSDNELKMLRYGYMDDEGVFKIEQLEDLHELQQEYKETDSSLFSTLKLMLICEAGNIRAGWKNMPDVIRNYGIMAGNKGVLYIAICGVLLCFVVLLRKRMLFIPLSMFIVDFALYFYLWKDLKVPFRAVYGLLFGTVIFMIYAFDKSDLRKFAYNISNSKSRICTVVLLCICIIVGIYGVNRTLVYNQYVDYFTHSQKEVEESEKLYDYLKDNSDKKYLLSNSCSSILSDSIWIVNKTDFNINYAKYTSVYFKSPRDWKYKENIGETNLFSALLKDEFYFVDSSETPHIDIMTQYLNRYYANGKSIEFEKTDTVGNHIIYKYILA